MGEEKGEACSVFSVHPSPPNCVKGENPERSEEDDSE